MALMAGMKLGPYEIVGPLGVGGMGEVYRATDTRLGRTVAIKVLPGHLSQNTEGRLRLEQEARTISKLAHPNVCTLHDIGHHEGVDFLVLEFVEGKTLRELMTDGTLSMRKVVDIAVQIAEGLAQAHEAGIVHRDLKPENLMVSNGIVKILDFGLAKLEVVEESDSNSTDIFESNPGVLMGTIQYMSPEQARGESLDYRSDQFSFGLVLYEMATGKRAFKRNTTSEALLAINAAEPEAIGALNPEAPPPLCWVVERCLAKDPEKRYTSTRDMARDLAELRSRLSDLTHRRPEAIANNLPVPGTPFVGRDKELAALKEVLLRADVRLVTVTGPGGIGKSRLALEVAREMGEQFTSGTYFVALAAVNEPEMIPFSIAQALGVRETAGEARLESLKKYLHSVRGPMLVLLDNFEQVVAGSAIIGRDAGAGAEFETAGDQPGGVASV